MEGALDDGVLLGVEAAAVFPALAGGDPQLRAAAADLFAVREARGGAVVPGGEEALVSHEDGPDPAPEAGGPARDDASHLEKVFVPAWSSVHRFATLLPASVLGRAEKEAPSRDLSVVSHSRDPRGLS